MPREDFLYLSEPELLKLGVLDAPSCIGVCEDVFRLLDSGDYLMGGRSHNEHGLVLGFPEHPAFPGMPCSGPERRYIAMPAYLGGGFHVCGEKWYGSNVENRKLGLPRSILMLMLNDPETAKPLALMSGNLISSMRTGCIPGVAFRYISDPGAETLTLVGTGPVHRATFLALADVMKNLRKVVVHATRESSCEAFISWAKGCRELAYETDMDFRSALGTGDVVSIAASPKEPLFVPDEFIRPGATVIFTSPVNADEALWTKSCVVFDNAKMHQAYYDEALSSGSLRNSANGWGRMYELIGAGVLPALSDAVSLGALVSKGGRAEANPCRKRVFVTSGMAVFDIGFGCFLYRKALAEHRGVKLNLWDEPYWT